MFLPADDHFAVARDAIGPGRPGSHASQVDHPGRFLPAERVRVLAAIPAQADDDAAIAARAEPPTQKLIPGPRPGRKPAEQTPLCPALPDGGVFLGICVEREADDRLAVAAGGDTGTSTDR